jgi:hypothetical protein
MFNQIICDGAFCRGQVHMHRGHDNSTLKFQPLYRQGIQKSNQENTFLQILNQARLKNFVCRHPFGTHMAVPKSIKNGSYSLLFFTPVSDSHSKIKPLDVARQQAELKPFLAILGRPIPSLVGL